MKKIQLSNGVSIPRLGQGTWYMGESPAKHDEEIKALRWGIEHGLTLIDTAEMYGEGASEILVGEAIQPYNRSDLFIVTKVYPWNAGRDKIFTSCRNSLKRLQTDYIDCYLLHWSGSVPFAETVECMEELVSMGLIRSWGVSNLDTDEMSEILNLPNGHHCLVDQVLYHLGSRGIEVELNPYLKKENVRLMAYCPLAQAGRLQRKLLSNPIVQKIAEDHQASVYQILLAFVLLDENVFAIPKASSVKHVADNLAAMDLELTKEEVELLNKEFPKPRYVRGLDMA